MLSRLLVTLTLVIVLAMSPFSSAQDHPHSPAIQSAIASFVEQGDLPGAVTIVVSHDRVLHAEAQGLASQETKQPMQLDSIFWIASMSKPVTAAAVMLLQQEGKLQLSDPISKYLPEMSALKLDDGTPAVITIEQCLSHTSGMEDLPPEQAYRPATLKEVTELYAKGRVLFPPGSQWRYCQSSINTAARIVEVVSGQTFDQFLQARIFAPLGMADTGFYLTDKQAQRLVTAYKKDGDKLIPVGIRLLYDKPATNRDHFPAGNGGLFSTALDYSRFCQMLLGKGERDGVRILTPESIAKMSSVVTGELKTGFTQETLGRSEFVSFATARCFGRVSAWQLWSRWRVWNAGLGRPDKRLGICVDDPAIGLAQFR